MTSSQDTEFAEILKKVEECSRNLSRLSCVTEDEDSHENLNSLIEVYYIVAKNFEDKLEKVCEVMINAKILKLFVNMWDKLHKNPSHLYSGDMDTPHGKLFLRFKILLWNYSDKSMLLCKEAYFSQVINRLMKEYSLLELDIANLKNPRIRHLMKANLGILHNFLRNFNKNREHVRKDNGIDVILKYYNSTYLIIKAKVVMLLAYCINEEENEKIMAGTGTIQFILDLLKSALESSNHVGKAYSFSALEIVLALNKLTSNDENKENIVSAGVLPYLVQLLDTEGTCCEEENLAAVDCIWALSFRPNNKDKIIQEQGLIEGIRILKSHPSSSTEVKRACEKTLFVLGVTPDPRPSGIKGKKKHVMLSYQWDVQHVILKLRDFLKEKNFLVWMDIEQMKGSILGEMANAVENSAVIMIAMTESYKNSNSCRTEAEYAYKRNIPTIPLLLQSNYEADGWLGALIGTKLYVDLSKGSPNEKLNEILPIISKWTSTSYLDRESSTVDGRHKTESIITNKQVEPFGSNPPAPTYPDTNLSHVSLISKKFICSSWDKAKVQKWCTSIGIKAKNLKNWNGVMLAQLCKCLLRSPNEYQSMIKDELKLQIEDRLNLTNAVEELISSS